MKLIFYSPELISQQQLVDYSLPDEQLIYSALPLDAIKTAEKDSSRHLIFLIDENKAPTFFVLHDQDGPKIYTDNPHAILLRSFSTDQKFQGIGYGKQALKLLPAFVRENFPVINEIILGVNSRNQAGIQLYASHGFVDTNKPLKTDYGQLRLMVQAL